MEPRTDDPDERFAPGTHLLVDGRADLVVSRTHWHSGRLLVTFDGIDDRTAAEGLRGLVLMVERDADAQADEDDAYYDTSLVGCAVVQTDGAPVGTVTQVVHLPAQDLLAVELLAGGEALVPFVAAICTEVDVVAHRIVIDPPQGLLDTDGAS